MGRVLQLLNLLVVGLVLISILVVSGLYLWLSKELPQLPQSLEHINLSLPTVLSRRLLYTHKRQSFEILPKI